MSTFIAKTKHPETGKWEWAEWIDNHFGHHKYGVRFDGEGHGYDVSNTALENKRDGKGAPKDVLERIMGIIEKEEVGPVACEEGAPSEPVKPKYQIGDSVFRLTVGGIREFNVWGIMKMLNGEFYYTFTLNSKLIDFNDWRSEQELFPTKEALLASL